MNQFKSIYMLLLPIILLCIIGFSIYNLFQLPLNLAWLATIITCTPLLLFLLDVIIFKSKPRTKDFLPKQTAISFIGLVASLLLFMFPLLQPNIENNHVTLALSELGFILHMAYIFWYSSLQRPMQNSLKIGSRLPSFVSFNQDNEVLSESFLGFPTIIIFYRGNWCPFCMAQIKELAQQYRELVLSGIKIVLISPQPELITEALAKRFNVPFIFLTDKNNQSAEKLGLNHSQGLPKGLELAGYNQDTVFPTVIVTDKTGKIVYLDETPSFRNRPEPSEYLNILLNSNSTLDTSEAI